VCPVRWSRRTPGINILFCVSLLFLSIRLLALLLLYLQQQRPVDMRQYTTEGDGGADERVELLITTDRKLQVTRGNTLNLQVLCGVACQLENFGGEVFEDGGDVYSCLCADAHLVLGLRLEETLDTAAWELQTGLRRVRLLRLTGVVAASLPTSLATSLALAASHSDDFVSNFQKEFPKRVGIIENVTEFDKCWCWCIARESKEDDAGGML